MLPLAIIVGVALLVAFTTGRRLIANQGLAPLTWSVLLLASAAPVVIGWLALNPGVPVDKQMVYGEKDKVSLQVPEGYALMVTASLSPEPDDEQEKVKAGKTNYCVTLSGSNFVQKATGTIKRKTAKSGGPDIDLDGGQGIKEGGTRRSGKWGEDLQDRFDLQGDGEVTAVVTNWVGTAAEALSLEVVKPPPPTWVLWIIIVVLSALAIFSDTRYGTDRLAGDVGLLTCFALFLRDGVTPLDDYQEVAFSIAAAALVGGLGVGGAAALAEKIWGRRMPAIGAKKAAGKKAPAADDA